MSGSGSAGAVRNWWSPSSTPTARSRSPATGAGSAADRRSATSTTPVTIPAAARCPATAPHAQPTRPRQAFLAIGDGAAAWLIEAAAAGAARVRSKMAEAVAFAKLHGPAAVDQALGTAALAGRFADDDLAAILAHQQRRPSAPPTRATETHSLQPGTAGWAGFGATNPGRWSAVTATKKRGGDGRIRRSPRPSHPDPRGGDRVDPPAADALPAQGRRRCGPHRPSPTLGPRRGAARAAV